MKKAFFCIILSYPILLNAFSLDTITYNIHFPNAVHHEAEISIQLENIDKSEIIALMSKSSPGRYAEHNFGKNIYNLNVSDAQNSAITLAKIQPDAWSISGIKNSVTINYTLYANHADGTYSGIDADFANLNMPATLIWIKEMEERPVKVIFNLPDTSNWKIATQLMLIDSSKNSYGAPNLQYLMDSPCILSNYKTKEFNVGNNEEYKIRMAINSEVTDGDLSRFAIMTESVLNEQAQIFGEYPNFMDSTYTFLCSYGPGFNGDGMEHRNSTMVSSSVPLPGNLDRLIGTVSHEFFHVWNIERIRPASLEPFDFTKANISAELWFGEGFTSYYHELTLCRAGMIEKDRYMNNISRMINYAYNAPSLKFGSPAYMSQMAAYTDNAATNDETNFSNTFFSYYSYGSIMALALDLSLRTEFDNVTLDDLMRAMWEKYGKKEIPYANEDIKNTLAEVCGNKDFASAFFNNHIYNNVFPDFENLFDKIGYKLIQKNPNKSSMEYMRLRFKGDTATLLSQPLIGSSIYEAGVNKGDLILSIDEQPVTSYPELNFIIGTRKVGDEVDIVFSHHGKLKTAIYKVNEDNQLILIPKEKFSIKVIAEESQRLDGWLKSRIAE